MALQKQIGLSVFAVTPRAGVWIETTAAATAASYIQVTPRAGVWIETEIYRNINKTTFTSLPVRECGLKRAIPSLVAALPQVTPRAGVWIETNEITATGNMLSVTPRAGVWIETCIA